MSLPAIILIPIYNDWQSLQELLNDFGREQRFSADQITFVIVDDGSPEKPKQELHLPSSGKTLHLHSNLGHQKAIAVGLAYIRENHPESDVLVMDGDGQDTAADALKLLELRKNFQNTILVARRTKRSESPAFRFFYWLFKGIFRLLTGKSLMFGNFSVIPSSHLGMLVFKNELWSHYAATILKSGLPIELIPLPRAARNGGKSKMSFNKLLLHGMGAFLVFIDSISVKLSYFSVIMVFLSLLMAAIILAVKLFTHLAIPGWASTILSSALLLFMQSFLLGFFTLFLYLTAQSQKRFIPALHFADYISNAEMAGYDRK